MSDLNQDLMPAIRLRMFEDAFINPLIQAAASSQNKTWKEMAESAAQAAITDNPTVDDISVLVDAASAFLQGLI